MAAAVAGQVRERSVVTVFEQCFAVTVGQEGVLSLDPSDRGNYASGRVGVGPLVGSKYGLSAMSYPLLDIRNLTLDQVKAIYARDYFDKAGCDSLPPPLAMLVFDSAVNCGPGIAAKWLQEAVGVPRDGMIGPGTLAAVAEHQGQGLRLLATYQAIRLRYMSSLAGWSHNRGWADRLMIVLLAATQMRAA